MKTITIYNGINAVSMFKVRASYKIAKIQAEQKKQSVSLIQKINIDTLTYSII